jgi:hypothetical protein
MPSFFSNYPKSDYPEYLNADAKAQIQAIRDHLFVTLGGGAKTIAAAGN